jgi:hypothetical protein
MKRAIITCVYNRLDHFKFSIESVVRNTIFDNYDYIISVDYNPDKNFRKNLYNLLEDYSSYKNISWIFRETNLGAKGNWTTTWDEVVDNYHYVLNIEDDIVLSKVALEYCRSMESKLNTDILGFCLWRDERWMNHFKENCYFQSFEFSGWGWYSKGENVRMFLEREKNIEWALKLQPNSLIEYLHLYKMFQSKFFWGDRLKSVYNRGFNKRFFHTSVSLAKNIGLDGSGVHSGISFFHQKELETSFAPPYEIFIADQDLVNYKYKADKKYSWLGLIYFRLWFSLKKILIS